METENEVLTELFEDYRGTLMNLCLAKGLSKEDSEDAISEAMCRFLDDYEDLEELNQFQQKRWLYNTLNNICHEIFRSKIRIVDDDISEYEEIIPDENDDFSVVIEDHEFERLTKLFEAELTETEKTAFRAMLVKDSGATYRELSEKYGVPLSTLTSITTRLRKKAKKILDKIFDS